MCCVNSTVAKMNDTKRKHQPLAYNTKAISEV